MSIVDDMPSIIVTLAPYFAELKYVKLPFTLKMTASGNITSDYNFGHFLQYTSMRPLELSTRV
jgi:hypothetical protein